MLQNTAKKLKLKRHAVNDVNGPVVMLNSGRKGENVLGLLSRS